MAGRRIRIRLLGNCASRQGDALTMYGGVESYLREQVPELDGIDLD